MGACLRAYRSGLQRDASRLLTCCRERVRSSVLSRARASTAEERPAGDPNQRRPHERVMGAKKAKTAQKTTTQQKHVCPDCGNEAKIVMYAGYGDRGLFWVCEKACGYKQRTR